jgi:hypothetical protein
MGISMSGALTPTGRTTTRANKAPTWSSTGNLGQTLGGKPFTANLLGTDPEGTTITYGIYDGGVLPSGLALSETGVLSGTPVNNPGVKTFPIYITDGVDVIPQTFTLEIQNATPVWATLAGSLGTINENTAFSISLSASDENLDTLTFTITAGSLPPGLTLASDGTISGTTGQVNQNTVYNFTVQVNDGATGVSSRAFSLTVNNNINQPPVWSTAAGSLGILNEQTDYSYNLSVTDPDVDDTITYNISSGTLPVGLSLNTATGVISGNTGVATGNVTYNFIIGAQDGHNPVIYRSFSITVLNNINEPPVWTTAAGSIGTFNQNASINFSFVATDQNGDGITYSVTSGALPTGLTLSSAGVITGSTSQTGTFNFTVTATDTNSGTTARAFTITSEVAGDQYWGNVTGLFHFDNNLTDSSGNITLTNNGVTFSNSISKFGGYSASFNGTTSGLSVSTPNSGAKFANDFTIEAWIYPTSIGTQERNVFATSLSTLTFNGIQVYTKVSGYLAFGREGVDETVSTTTPTINSWNHVALTRSGSTIILWLNGVNIASATNTVDYSDGNLMIGTNKHNNAIFAGYIDDFRITNGVARYTTNFSASLPTAALQNGLISAWTTASTLTNGYTTVSYSTNVNATGSGITYNLQSGSLPTGLTLNASTGAITGTPTNVGSSSFTIRATDANASYTDKIFTIQVLVNDTYWNNVTGLFHFDNNLTDSSGNITLTNSGVTFSSSTIKFDGYSASFNGSSYLEAPLPMNYVTSTNDITIEGWFRLGSLSKPATIFVFDNLAGGPNSGWFGYSTLYVYTNGTLGFGKSGINETTTATGYISINTWYHFAMVKTSTGVKIYINGVAAITTDSTRWAISTTIPLRFGACPGNIGAVALNGYMDDVRITNGVARYTANFTPPTVPYPNH